MKKSVLKIMAITIAATIATGVSGVTAASVNQTSAEAGTSTITPRYTAIQNYYNDLTVSSSGVLSCYGRASVYSPYTAGVKVELQQNGTTIKTWNAKGGLTATVDETKTVASGGNTYRLRLTYTAYNSSGGTVETLVSYSEEVVY